MRPKYGISKLKILSQKTLSNKKTLGIIKTWLGVDFVLELGLGGAFCVISFSHDPIVESPCRFSVYAINNLKCI